MVSRYHCALCLGDAAPGLAVHADDAEALVIAVGPFGVVQKGPDEVAAHIGAQLAGPSHRGDVLGQVRSAVVVLNEPGLVGLRSSSTSAG